MLGTIIAVMGRCIALLVSVTLVGCLTAPRDARRAESADFIVVEIAGGAISIDGKHVADKAELLGVLTKRTEAGASVLVVNASSRDDAPSVALVLASVAALRIRRIDLHVADLDMQLRGSYQTRPSSTLTIAAQFLAGAGSLWSVGATSGALAELGSVKIGDRATEDAAASHLKQACSAQGCDALVTIDDPAQVIEVLRSWKRVSSDMLTRVIVGDGVATEASTASTRPTGTGWLHPDVIQLIVRAHFWSLKTCYEQGLARDPKLSGAIAVRFVIRDDGKVTGAEDAGSTIPDQEVRDCVIHSFGTFTFPRPRGGIVTVVYPIKLSP